MSCQLKNRVEIKVTNLWVNRLLGDKQQGVTNTFTSTSMPYYQADSPLVPSGLLGPDKIIAVKKGAPASSYKLQQL